MVLKWGVDPFYRQWASAIFYTYCCSAYLQYSIQGIIPLLNYGKGFGDTYCKKEMRWDWIFHFGKRSKWGVSKNILWERELYNLSSFSSNLYTKDLKIFPNHGESKKGVHKIKPKAIEFWALKAGGTGANFEMPGEDDVRNSSPYYDIESCPSKSKKQIFRLRFAIILLYHFWLGSSSWSFERCSMGGYL